MAETVAAIDCGTNSVRLLIARGTAAGFAEVERALHLTRLGQGVDATGRFHPDALARTFAAVDDFALRIAAAGATRLRFVATSAARDAANREEFFDGVRRRLGVDAEVISGDEEAALSFAGAVSALPDAEAPVLVMDIGGGSTELVLAGVDGVARGLSLDMGSVRLRERFLHGDPPTADQVSDAAAFVDSLLDASGVDIGSARTFVGVGGTATSVSALVQELPAYDRSRVHCSVVTRDAVSELAERLLAAPVAEVVTLPTMQPGRADVICAGALICARVAARASVDLTVSEADILDGLVAGLLRSVEGGGES